MTLTSNLRSLAGLAAVSTALGFATAAVAAPDKPSPAPGQPAGGQPAGGKPTLVPASDFRPVSVEISILDAAGQVVDSRSCEWTVPGDDDRPCLKFKSDPQFAFEAIEEAGGTSATERTVSEPIALDSVTKYSRRSDGTWLIRTRGTAEGKAFHNGRVCTADGQRCVRFDATTAKSSVKNAKAAASKLRRQR